MNFYETTLCKKLETFFNKKYYILLNKYNNNILVNKYIKI